MLQRDLPNLPAAGMVGLSLGEYPALMAAESLAIDAGFALLKDRGQYMQKAADEVASTLAAVIDPDIEQVEKSVRSCQMSGLLITIHHDNW